MKSCLVGLLLFLGSCAGHLSPPDAPEDLIQPDQMVNILCEMMVLESNMQQRFQHVSNFYKVMTVSGNACLKRHHVTKKQYEASMIYYISRQSRLQAIYTRVMNKLTRESAEISAKSIKDLDLKKTIKDTNAVVEPKWAD